MLTLATERSLRAEGQELSAKILKNMRESEWDGDTVQMLNDSASGSRQLENKLSPDRALALLLSCNLTKKVYVTLRQTLGNLPSYQTIQAAKAAALPGDMEGTELKCEVNLQSLLDHTVSRILKILNTTNIPNELVLYCKYGFDGSSGHAQYKQVWETLGKSDSSLFISALVPLELRDRRSNQIVWENTRPSSPLFTRPIRMQWLREDSAVLMEENRYLEEKIADLHPYRTENITVNTEMVLSMVDGKVTRCH